MTKRMNLLLLAIAMVLALFTTGVIVHALSSAGNREHTSTVKVVVVAKSVQAHQVVGVSDVQLKDVPAVALESGAFTSLADVVGRFSSSDWFKGQQVIAPMVVSDGSPAAFPLKVPVGERAFTLGNDAVSGVDHLASPGDHVDILVAYATDKQFHGPVTQTLLQNILVLYADNQPQPSGNTAVVSNGTATQSGTSKVDTITVAVSPKQAKLLYFGVQFGQIHLTLRHPHDNAVDGSGPETTGLP